MLFLLESNLVRYKISIVGFCLFFIVGLLYVKF